MVYDNKSNLIRSAPNFPLQDIKDFLQEARDEVLLVAPYIQTETFNELKIPKNLRVTVITTLKLNDLLTGASDINFYPYAKSNSLYVFYNNRIHLKAYLRDWNDCILGSSNLSNRGMGVGSKYNYELNCIVGDLDDNSIIYFRKILQESHRMTDAVYESVKEKLNKLPVPEDLGELDLSSFETSRDYLISSLPMSVSIERLYELGQRHFSGSDPEEKNCAIHDTILFDINYDTGFEEFKVQLSGKFFSSGFISELLDFIGKQGRYFREVKEWIQKNCQDVPVPSSRDLTGNIQVLYRWIVDLSDGKYLMDRPNYSQRIYEAK